jgi:predicted acyltransferase
MFLILQHLWECASYWCSAAKSVQEMMKEMSATLTAPGQILERTTTAPPRVQSVDVLRGLTIALMILVNDPGDWGHVFKPLDHADWNGWTLTDLVFPTFLFLMGASMVFSLQTRTNRGDCRKTLTGHLFSRTGKLLLLTFVLVYFPRMHFHTLRYFGVISRIAVCGLLAGLVLIATTKLKNRVAVLVGVVALLLVGYWILLRWVPVPGIGMPGRDMPFMDENLNMTSWMDRGFVGWTQHWFHTGSLYKKTRDPEGLLSTLPAIGTVLLGALSGMWMRAEGFTQRMRLGLASAGIAAVAAGELWSVWFPINKNLWTSSYVLLAAGIAALVLAALSWLMDGREQPWPKWLQISTWPWFVFGSNAIVAYTTSAVLVKAAIYFKITDADGDRTSVWSWIYENVFARHGSGYWTSLAFAVCFVVVCFLPNWFLWRKKWFWKV